MKPWPWGNRRATNGAILVAAATFFPTIYSQEAPCINAKTGKLVDGIALESGKCVPLENSFFRSLEPAPTSSNGLQAGSPVDIVLKLSKPGGEASSSSTESIPTTPGLPFPEGGKVVLDFSSEFEFNPATSQSENTDRWIGMGTSDGNMLFGGAECFERRLAPQVVCANWTSSFGANKKQIVISALGDSQRLVGARAEQLGIKFIHVRPALGVLEASYMYRMPSKMCTNGDSRGAFCTTESECPSNFACRSLSDDDNVVFSIRPSVMITIYGADGSMLHRATQHSDLQTTPQYAIYNTNAGLISHTDLIESVDWQEAPSQTLLDATRRNTSTSGSRPSFAAGAPYAPRFVLFVPNVEGRAFPHPTLTNSDALVIDIFAETKGIILHQGMPIASIQLLQPEDDAGGSLLVGTSTTTAAVGANAETTVHSRVLLTDQSTDFGGTLLAIPMRTGTAPGIYTVRITLPNGQQAVSRTVVHESPSNTNSTGSSGSRWRPGWTLLLLLGSMIVVLG